MKKSISLPLFSHDKCVQAYPHDIIPKHVICAGGILGEDTCRGDSGGPLIWMKESPNREEIWGVTSIGATVCGREGKPGIYTSVVDYLSWIKEASDIR